jgi:hypothetical protein
LQESSAYTYRVAAGLAERGIRYFYDVEQEVLLWGKDLVEELRRIYSNSSTLVVIFVSKEYARKDWPRHERRAALSRALKERDEYVLPARFDETDLPGLLPALVYVDLRVTDPERLAELIAAKLTRLRKPPSWINSIDLRGIVEQPTGITNHENLLYVADHLAGEVVRLDSDGAVTARTGGFKSPHHLFMLEGRVLVADTGTVGWFA